MRTLRFLLLIPLVLAFLIFSNDPVCYANSAEPPSIIVIVTNAPNDLEMSIGSIKAQRKDKLNESYFSLYSRELRATTYTLNVSTNNQTFSVTGVALKTYNNVFTLDLQTRTLTPGKSALRSFNLLTARVLATLIIEGALFLMLGYRKKASWIVFLLVNLLTQGALFLWLSDSPPLNDYLGFSLVMGEFFVFFIELAAFALLVKEHERSRIVFYVITANFLSLIAGGFLINILPI